MGEQNTMLGLSAVLAACCSSGFAGVYFEKVLKTTRTGLWMRNCQLAFFSLLLSPVTVYSDLEAISEKGFFHASRLDNDGGRLTGVFGFMVAMVVKYADSVQKGFATSISIL